MQNEHGIDCPLNWENVNKEVQYIAAHPNGKLIGYGKLPILKDSGVFFKLISGDDLQVNFWDCQMDKKTLIELGKYYVILDVSKHIWQRPQP
jgi:hypothetical protein